MEERVMRQREGTNFSQPTPVPSTGISSAEASNTLLSYLSLRPALRPMTPEADRSGSAESGYAPAISEEKVFLHRSAYDNDENVTLTLIEGRVVVKEVESGREHVVRPLEEIRVAAPKEDSDGASVTPEISHADIQKSTAWVNGEFVFDNTPNYFYYICTLCIRFSS